MNQKLQSPTQHRRWVEGGKEGGRNYTETSGLTSDSVPTPPVKLSIL